jgi:hypothetical protein
MKNFSFTFKHESESVVIAFINELPKSHRAIIARVIWWDFYAGRLVCNRTARFDGFLNEPIPDPEPSNEALSLSLQKVGYDKATADKRFSDKYKPTLPRKK